MTLGLANQQTNAIPQRKFVDGEKFWMAAHDVHHDGVILQFYSDPFGDTRRYGKLKLPFQKGKFPAADDIMKAIAEVIAVDAAEEGAALDAPAPTGTTEPAPPAPIVNGKVSNGE